ncbi:unnamed protein product [Echinostoma caproni]|uniref:Uncharacterized protein n=1 Tax=Echinostoma caproni TaxID=27848 RepID=A0A3P8L606_9TREM|nr:unnamed protein product [Echinostoma caproni]
MAAELLKLVATLYALHLRGTLDQGHEQQRAPVPQLPGPRPMEKPHSPPSETLGPAERNDLLGHTNRPFVRLVTHGRAVLVHMGQLLSILDDHSGFLLHRVVSFDPQRVQLHMVADLKPRDILALTESKRTREVKRLLNQSDLKADSERGETHIDVGTVESRAEMRPGHGPLLITPGLVLIRVSQVKELAILPESDQDTPSKVLGLFNPNMHHQQRTQETSPSTDLSAEYAGSNPLPSVLENEAAVVEQDPDESPHPSCSDKIDCTVIEENVVKPELVAVTQMEPEKQGDDSLCSALKDEATNGDELQKMPSAIRSVPSANPTLRGGRRKRSKSDSLPSTSKVVGMEQKSKAVSFSSIIESTPLMIEPGTSQAAGQRIGTGPRVYFVRLRSRKRAELNEVGNS